MCFAEEKEDAQAEGCALPRRSLSGRGLLVALLVAWVAAPAFKAHVRATSAGWEDDASRALFLEAASADPDFPFYRLQGAIVRYIFRKASIFRSLS